MKVIGLFSGIGGFELAFQREGFEVVSVCEIDPYCQKVLKSHFPKAKLNPDIRSCSREDFLAKTSPLPVVKLDCQGLVQVSGLNSDEAFRNSAQTLLSLRMLHTHGGAGCPVCGSTLLSSGMPACRYECEPVTWEPPTNEPESSLLPTPTASSYGSCRGGGAGRVGKWRASLSAMAKHNTWPTPTARDWKSGASNLHNKNCRPLNEVVFKSEGGGPLNPTWVEWLMGFPLGWTESSPSETPSSRSSRKSSQGGLKK
jgi:hypothetical protein